MSSLEHLSPQLVWSHFALISSHPHPSGGEAPLTERLVEWAQSHSFAHKVDRAGNLVIHVPATSGHEMAPTTVLQGHLDMVCEARGNAPYDFTSKGIELVVDGEWIKAKDTTLGADNGIGVAAAMAAAEDPKVVHGPLILLLTVEEEVGLIGARELDPALVQEGRYLINLDSEEDGALYVGCAGGGDDLLTLPIGRRSPAPSEQVAWRLSVSGLKGGHSGLNIHENLGNAIKLQARWLHELMRVVPETAVVRFDGGTKHNAIPRDAEAVVILPAAKQSEANGVVDRLRENFLTEFRAVEPALALRMDRLGSCDQEPMEQADARRLVTLLIALPHGVFAMSRDIPGLVETSNNLGVVQTKDDVVTVLTSTRSSVDSALNGLREQIRAVGSLAGTDTNPQPAYPGWQPELSSELLGKARGVFERLHGKAPSVKAIHAGLECGLLKGKFPQMEMISFGPEIHGAHSPDERLSIPSTVRFWEYLKALLEELA